MTAILVRKLWRDIWVPLVVVAVLLCAFECLWAHVTRRISTELIPEVTNYIIQTQRFLPSDFLPPELKQQAEQIAQNPEKIAAELQQLLFKGPGKLIQQLIGGESINLTSGMDLLSVGYVHPLVQTILCIWAIGRAAGAITGEIDRGTMELLLAQPVPRWKLILAHLYVDLSTIPILCLSMWGGIWLGSWLVGLTDHTDTSLRVYPLLFGPALINVALLLFAVSGCTLFFSSLGRFRGRVLGFAVLFTLLQFLVNVIGQLWDAVNSLRPFTVFYYYQPQQIILHADWWNMGEIWLNFAILFGVGATGYALALWRFSQRDLPAPL